MAIEKVIDIKVTSNLDNANKSVTGLKDNLKDTSNAANKTEKSVSDVSKSTGGITSLGDSLGKLSPTFASASSGASALLKQMILLVSNPLGATIVAIVGAMTLLFKAFSSTKDGADKLSQVMAGLSSVVDVVRDRILKVGGAIVKFFTGDFKGALEDGKAAVSGFGDEVADEFKKAANATKDLQQVEDAFNALSVSRARVNRDLAISKELLTDENASYAEKKKALDLIKETEGRQTEQELANARKKFEAIKRLNALSDTSREDKKKEQDAEAELFRLQEESARNRRTINKQEKTLLNEKLSQEKEVADKRKAIAVEAETRRKENYANEKTALEESLKQEGLNYEQRRNLIKENLKLTAEDRKKFNDEINKEEQKSIEAHNKSIEDLNKRYDDEKANRLADTAEKKAQLDYDRRLAEIEGIANTELEKQTLIEKLDEEHKARLKVITDDAEKERTKVEEENFKARLEIDKLEYEHKRKMLGATTALLDTAAGALGDSTVAGKAAAVASATIKTLLSSVDAFQGMVSAIPGPAGIAAGIAASGFAVLTGFKTVKNILAVKTPKASGGSSVSSPNISGVGGASAPQFNVVGNAGTNQLAQTLANQNQQPIQAYVVSGAVTTAQSLDRNIISNASIG